MSESTVHVIRRNPSGDVIHEWDVRLRTALLDIFPSDFIGPQATIESSTKALGGELSVLESLGIVEMHRRLVALISALQKLLALDSMEITKGEHTYVFTETNKTELEGLLSLYETVEPMLSTDVHGFSMLRE